MYSIKMEELKNRRGLRFYIDMEKNPAAFSDVIHAWKDEAGFRSFFNAALADAPYSAYRWETPPVSPETIHQSFEFVLVDSPSLARRPNPVPFAKHFNQSPEKDVLVFPNLGGDALLIVPRKKTTMSAYGHLAAFTREAPESQRHLLWQTVGESMLRQLDSSRPVWLNTAGGGISWLHVRLDERPKYYVYGPYRQMA